MLKIVADKSRNPSDTLIEVKGYLFTHTLVKCVLVRFGRFLSMLAFRDPVCFHLMASIFNTLCPSSLQKEKGDHGDRMPEAQVPQPQRDTCHFSSCFIDQSCSPHPTQMQGGLKESPWQAATSQHELHMMQGEHTSLSQPLLLTHAVAVKVK